MLWAVHEAGTADFGDTRLTQRLVTLLTTLSVRPTASIPEACETWAPTKAAYRFVDNPRVTPTAIMAAHRQAAVDRVRSQALILAVQDTTTFNFTLHRQTTGLGPIGQAGLAGFFLHSCLAVSPEGIPLGVLGAEAWARDPESKDSHHTHKHRPLAEKESARWLRLMDAATEDIPTTTRVVMVADREGDIFDGFAHATETHRDVLIRAAWNRRLTDPVGYLWDVVAHPPALGTVTITVPRHDDAPSRLATLTLRTARVTLRPPSHRRAERLPAPTVTAVLAREERPPAGPPPVEWMLLTTLPVTTREEAVRMVRWYTYRWRIERYHYVLKSGCRVEDLQLATRDRLERALAVYRLVAWRLLWWIYQAREHPAAPCTTVLRPTEWAVLYAAHHHTALIPETPVDLQTAIRWIAQLGGFLGRRHDGEPGVKVLWRGYRRLEDLAALWEILHPPDTPGTAGGIRAGSHPDDGGNGCRSR